MTLKDRDGSFFVYTALWQYILHPSPAATADFSHSVCRLQGMASKKKGWHQSMKSSKTYLDSIGIFIGVVIAILALMRGTWQTWLLLWAFILWILWALAVLLLPRMRQAKRRKNRRRQTGRLLTSAGNPDAQLQIPEIGNPSAEILLLRHVNHRISAYLRSAYPDAAWEWTEKRPERLILLGGTGRIRVFGVPDFGHADITLDRQGNINCSMVKIVPLLTDKNGIQDDCRTPPNKQPADPQIWYEIQGRKVLETLVADLNSRGHSSLILHENGDACVEENQKESPKEHLANFPEKVYWPRLVQVFEGNGLAAEITADGIRISW